MRRPDAPQQGCSSARLPAQRIHDRVGDLLGAVRRLLRGVPAGRSLRCRGVDRGPAAHHRFHRQDDPADRLVDPADQQRTPYYLARIEISPQGLGDLGRQKLDLVAGMPAEFQAIGVFGMVSICVGLGLKRILGL